MGWFTDYLEKLSLIDYAANKMSPAQKPSPFLWKPFSRRSREAYFAEQRARAKEAEDRFARERARREKVYAEQERLHAIRMRCGRSSTVKATDRKRKSRERPLKQGEQTR